MPLIVPATRVARSFMPRVVRNWLRSPSATVKWAWDGVRFSFGIRKVVQMRPGWSLTCHPTAYRCAYSAQNNDPEQIAEFDGFISQSFQGMTLFDIGAHFGLFSLAALHYGGPEARAIAVDPSPVAISFLNIQAQLNHNDDRLHVIQAAVSDRAGLQSMISVGVLASGYFVAPTEAYPASELTQTRAITLDGMVDELGAVPTHIKVDVEGYEAAVLRGGHRILSQTSGPILFIEIHNEIVCSLGRNPEETLILLRDYGYTTFTTSHVPITADQILAKPLIRIIATKQRA